MADVEEAEAAPRERCNSQLIKDRVTYVHARCVPRGANVSLGRGRVLEE